MSTNAGGGAIPPESFVRRILRGFSRLLITLLAAAGLLLGALELHSWHAGVRWTPNDISTLIEYSAPTRAISAAVWEDFKFLIQYGAFLLGAIAFVAALAQLKTIARLISDFIVARGPIYTLGTTIAGVETSVELLSKEVDRLSKLEPTIKAISEKLEATAAQINNLQRLAVSERTTATEDQATRGAIGLTAPETGEDRNWERLRELWNNNGERLDQVIEGIPNKRRRQKFQRMPRTNYAAIINALADERYISEAARKASLDLHSTFMSYKPRNRRIPDSAVGNVVVLDGMLADELSVPTADDDASTSPPPVDSRTPEPV
jgi:hypothetical protein